MRAGSSSERWGKAVYFGARDNNLVWRRQHEYDTIHEKG
ncbi:hypothetical protein E6C60_3577 [Paenibacillus algicola]|uniref:Uncharacterized protein n=1 Tax=Paenibacillus algicola TaxID=2565926 RepID=A0A4P8XN43_9BACL|nr:hypothetical protein E6C60_3577 [Paenibacillus algicola]